MTPNKQGAAMIKRKLRYLLAALAITFGPVVATALPAAAQLSGCSGYSNPSGAYVICSGGSGLQKAYVTYYSSFFGGNLTRYAPTWSGPGQWSDAFVVCYGTCHVVRWGWIYG